MPAIVRISCIDDAPLSMSAFEMSAVLPINNAHNTLTAMSQLQIYFSIFTPLAAINDKMYNIVIFVIKLFNKIVDKNPEKW